jgi:hypothetical protein
MTAPEPVAIRQLLATAARLAVPPAEVQPLSWSWQVYGESLELYVERAYRSAGGYPAGRLAAIVCGVALHRAQLVFAALGARGVVRLDNNPEHSQASVAWTGRHTATAHDNAMLQALSGEITPPQGIDTSPNDIEVLLSRAARPFGVTTYRFDDAINRFLDANAARRPSSAYGDLALITSGDTVADWLCAGHALSAALLTAAVAGLTASVHSLAATPGMRALLRSLAVPGGQPQILIRVATATKGVSELNGVPMPIASAIRESGALMPGSRCTVHGS